MRWAKTLFFYKHIIGLYILFSLQLHQVEAACAGGYQKWCRRPKIWLRTAGFSHARLWESESSRRPSSFAWRRVRLAWHQTRAPSVLTLGSSNRADIGGQWSWHHFVSSKPCVLCLWVCDPYAGTEAAGILLPWQPCYDAFWVCECANCTLELNSGYPLLLMTTLLRGVIVSLKQTGREKKFGVCDPRKAGHDRVTMDGIADVINTQPSWEGVREGVGRAVTNQQEKMIQYYIRNFSRSQTRLRLHPLMQFCYSNASRDLWARFVWCTHKHTVCKHFRC